MEEPEAQAIVNEASSRGVTAPFDEGATTVEKARTILHLASQAYDAGARGDDVVAIMTMGGLLEPVDGEKGDTPSTDEGRPPDPPEDLPPPVESRGITGSFPIPAEIEGEPPEMPRDLTSISDRECRRLHGEFSAWLNRVVYLIGVEKSDLANAETIMDAKLREAKRGVRLADPGRSQASINMEAEEDPDYQEWALRLSKHKGQLAQLYAFRDIYAGNVERLSRDWKMRRDEWEMSGRG